jgi:hypothetical protein
MDHKLKRSYEDKSKLKKVLICRKKDFISTILRIIIVPYDPPITEKKRRKCCHTINNLNPTKGVNSPLAQ